MLAVGRASGLVDRGDAGVLQTSQGLGFALEELHLLLVHQPAAPDDLQGDGPAGMLLLRLVDHAHPAFAELADQPIAADPLAERGRSSGGKEGISRAGGDGKFYAAICAARGELGIGLAALTARDDCHRRLTSCANSFSRRLCGADCNRIRLSRPGIGP